MRQITYQDYLSYNVRSSFSQNPGDIIRCPMCSGTLTKSVIGPSKAVEDRLSYKDMSPWLAESSRMSTCDMCPWWCVREHWAYEEWAVDHDCLIAGIPRKWNWAGGNTPFFVLREYFKKKETAQQLAASEARALRKAIAECLQCDYHPCEVYLVGTCRQGDVYLVKDDAERAVLVKREWSTETEPVIALEYIERILLRDGEYNGAIITSASPLTHLAVMIDEMPVERIKPMLASFFLENMSARYFRGRIKSLLTLIEKTSYDQLNSLIRDFEYTLKKLPRGIYEVQSADRAVFCKMLERSPREIHLQPWLRALGDIDVYNDALPLPREFVSSFNPNIDQK
jgi:hypothetical protein